MKVLRIKLTQNQASYTKEETIYNRMTYPLPPYSTIIGALHNACSYTTYHPMNISIQGKYGAMQREIYVNHGLLNNREDDRNILAYFENPNLQNSGYISVAEGLNKQGNSFLKNKTIRIDNEYYYRKFIGLENKKMELNSQKDEVKEKVKVLNNQEKELKAKQKKFDKNSEDFITIKNQIKKIKEEYNALDQNHKDKFRTEYTEPSSHFRTLVKSPKYQEVLYDVELVIHIQSDEQTLNDIKESINSFNCLGRSEDFIDLVEIKEVDIVEAYKDFILNDNYKMYVDIKKVNDKDEDELPYFYVDGDNKLDAKGTVYFINKEYTVKDNKRIFNKIPCLYTSNIGCDAESGYVVDQDGYIVNLN